MCDVELTSDLLFDEHEAWDDQQHEDELQQEVSSSQEDLAPQDQDQDQEPDEAHEAAPSATLGGMDMGAHARFGRPTQSRAPKLATSAPVKMLHPYRWRTGGAADDAVAEASPERPANTFVPLHIKDVPAVELFGTSYEKRPLKMFALREKRLRQMGWYGDEAEKPKPWAGLNAVMHKQQQWDKP